MRVRSVLVALSLLAFLSTSSGGYLYYSSLRESAVKEVERQAVANAHTIRNHISSYLRENLKGVRVLAGLEEVRKALEKPGEPQTLAGANEMLDHFNWALRSDVCYLMDCTGTTIASSNREAPNSFVGQDYSFRPYFKRAVRGETAVYMALGVTSGKRGVYYSHPVYGGEPMQGPLGAAVVKATIEPVEKEFLLQQDGIVVLADENGVVFASNRPDWIFHHLWRLPPEKVRAIVSSRQFGRSPVKWVGLEFRNKLEAVDGRGVRYLVHRMDLPGHPGWHVLSLNNLDLFLERISHPLIRISGVLIASLCLIVGLAVFILFRKANQDILQRRLTEDALRESEEALREAQEDLSRYSEDLERQVRRRTAEITSILENTPAVVYIKDSEYRYVMTGSKFNRLFLPGGDSAKGKTDYDIFPRGVADQFRKNDESVLRKQEPVQVEETVPLEDGDHVYLSVKFPLIDEQGLVRAVCGISTDITELKKAQDQLRRLSGRIMDGQEQERSAIARELHDELGQLLTALRMDAVWLQDRLEPGDAAALERAGEMCRLIDQTIDEVRRISIGLRPGVLDDLGLIDALEWYTEECDRRAGFSCVFSHNGMAPVRGLKATAAYRIAQEALTNVARHSGAAVAEVELTMEEGSLTLTITDDGKGFDTGRLSENDCLGVAGMRERAGLVNGTLHIESHPGGGTKVRFHAPTGCPPSSRPSGCIPSTGRG